MSSSLTYFSSRAARRLRKRVAAVLMSTALAAASAAWAADKPGDIEADALRSVLTAEIALPGALSPGLAAVYECGAKPQKRGTCRARL